jgi:hypothetical protein
MLRRLVRTACVLALAIAAAGCGGGTVPGARATDPSSPDAAAAIRSAMAAAQSPGPTLPVPAQTQPAPRATQAVVNPSPSPPQFEWESTLPVEATLSPLCVRPGGTMSIVVQTRPKYAVAYNAEYAGTQGGAPPPYGAGYGGNDKGYPNPDGVYRSSWVVSPQAPAGPARVDVIVADGEAWGYDNPDFAVAGPSGTC